MPRPRHSGTIDRIPVEPARASSPTPASRRRAQRQLVAFAGVLAVLETVVFVLPIGGQLTPFALVIIPAGPGLLLAAVSGGRVQVRALIRRVGRWRVPPGWYLAAVLIPLGEKVTVDVAAVLLGQTTPARLVAALTVGALAVPLVVVVPALLEEVGWRGYAVQTALDGGRSPLWAALVVGGLSCSSMCPSTSPGTNSTVCRSGRCPSRCWRHRCC
jgi:membrane protease YdiL (CAAX protease family)